MKHHIYKGNSNAIKEEDGYNDIKKLVKKDLSKLLESKNLSFLIGSGCSLGEFGIPTMKELADNLFAPTDALNEFLKERVFSEDDKKKLLDLNVNFLNPPFRYNLETFLGTLYSYQFFLNQVIMGFEGINTTNMEEEEKETTIEKISSLEKSLQTLNEIIKKTKEYILYECLNEKNIGKDEKVLGIYKQFYRKLTFRDSNLPKPNVFTTNYDLFSERAMDNLGITYTNGFSGFVERFFNPSIFNYALAEQMDISSLKWSVIDSFIYLFKIHGSVNWIERESDNKLFSIQEIQSVNFEKMKEELNYLIYPSPLKQNASLGSPYSDLFREFQKRITQKQSSLVTLGYSFGDEHINNIIFQALTIPSFRLIIFSDIGSYKGETYSIARKNIDKLKNLNDPRIWIIGTDSEYDNDDKKKSKADEKELHFFETIANDLFPDYNQNEIEDANNNVIKLINEVVKNESK